MDCITSDETITGEIGHKQEDQDLTDWKFVSSRHEIIRLISVERRRQRLTQQELAQRTGLKQSNISRLETGKSNPSIEFLARVAAGLGKELQIRLK